MFKLDDREIKRFERQLGQMKEEAIPYATRQTLNTVAFNTMKTAKINARVNMVMRNKWTEQSIRFDKAKSLHIAQQMAAVGSVAPYMVDQEFGGAKLRRGRKGVPIPTSYAAGQEGAQPRTRLPRSVNKLANIQLKRGKKPGKSLAQQNKAIVAQAIKERTKFVFLDLGRRQGLFRVERSGVRMVYDLSRARVIIPKDPWLKPSVNHEAVKLPTIYIKALQFQLDRIK